MKKRNKNPNLLLVFLYNLKEYGFLFAMHRTFEIFKFYITLFFNKIFKTKIYFEDKYSFKKHVLPKKKNKTVTKKKEKNVYIFSIPSCYDIGGGQRPTQLAKTFNKNGFNIIYIYLFKPWPNTDDSIDVYASKHLYIDKLNINSICFNSDDIVIFESPSKAFEPYLDKAYSNNSKIIYENIDNWETSLGDKVYDYDTLVKMLQKSTLVIATAKKLLDQTKDYLKILKIKKDVLYLPNAVDESIFNPYMEYEIPKDFVKGKKTILYYGSLWGEWFDWDLVKYVATSNPTYSFIMIGNYKPINNIKKDMPKNIHFLGEKPQKELPAYLKYSDYTIIPFKVKEISDYVSPLKVFEYLSMNKPVIISTKMDISNYPNVYISKTKEEFNNLIKSNIVFDNSLMKDFVSNNSWDNRFEVIMDNLKIKNDYIKKFKNNISVVVLNYNNEGIIQRCIDSLIKYNERYNYEIIVVDNESTDGSYENIVKKYKNNKEVKIFKNSVNGCSSGRNLGVSKSKKDYIMFLDSDEYVLHKYWLDTFLSIIDKKNVGAVSWSGGWFNDEGITHIVLERLPYNYLEPNIIATSNIGYLSTCGLLITRELFNEIKGFDENYDPTCFEDTDLSLKIRNKKKILYYSRYLGVFHTPHQTTKQEGNKEYSIQLNKNRKYFVDKWMNINPKLITKYNENKINYRSKKM